MLKFIDLVEDADDGQAVFGKREGAVFRHLVRAGRRISGSKLPRQGWWQFREQLAAAGPSAGTTSSRALLRKQALAVRVEFGAELVVRLGGLSSKFSAMSVSRPLFPSQSPSIDQVFDDDLFRRPLVLRFR